MPAPPSPSRATPERGPISFPLWGHSCSEVVMNRVTPVLSTLVSRFLSVGSDGVLCLWNWDALHDPLLSVDLNSLVFLSHSMNGRK